MRKPILRIVLTLALAAALPMTGRAQTTAPARSISATAQFAGRPIQEVRILGNSQVATSVIRNAIRVRPGDKYDPATVQEDYQRVYELKKFANVEAQVEPTATGDVVVYFIVTEQKLIRKITFHGNSRLDAATLAGSIDLKAGQAIDDFRIAVAKQDLISLYRDKNFPFARVDVPPDPLTQRGELIFNIVEGPQVRIRNIAFLGNRSFLSSELNHQIKTSTWFPIFSAGKYDPELVEEDMGTLRKYYQDRGFFDVRVGRKLIFSPDQSELQIDFLIDEGPRYVIERVTFAGNSRLSDAVLRKTIRLTEGRYYDAEASQTDVHAIVNAYSPFGFIYLPPNQPGQNDPDYLHITPQTVFLPQRGRIELLYNIREGKPFRLDRIIIKGNDKTQQKVILREFRDLFPGELYNSGAVQDAVERLRALRFFGTVTATPIGDDPGSRSLLVEVTEDKTASFNIGAGISSNGGLTGNISYEQRNFDITNVPSDWRDILSEHAFTGAGQGFRISFSPGTIFTSADLRFSEPWLFDQPYNFIEDVYLRDALREHYTDRRIGDAVTFGKYLDYQDAVSVTLRGETVRIFDLDDARLRPAEILAQRGSHVISSAQLQFQRDTTNPGFIPYQGNTFDAAVEGFGALGGDYAFQRFTFGWSGYQTLAQDLLDRRTVLALHLNTGFITGRSVFFERFYAGDIGSVRGFRYRGISPRGGRGEDPVGGDFYFTGTAEVSFPIYENMLRGVLFVDFGDVERDVRFGVIRSSVGPGVRFSLPFLGPAPIALYVGFPITKAGHDEQQAISFSLGGKL